MLPLRHGSHVDPNHKGEQMMRSALARPVRAGFLVVAAVATAAFLLVTPAVGAPPAAACEARNNNQYDKLLECMTLAGVREHQAALQAIADANGGTRAAATPGYDASVDYVIDTMEAAGWNVSVDEFDFTVNEPIQQHTPTAATHPSGSVLGSGLGTVTDDVVPVDINLTPPRANTSGCDGAFTEAGVGAPLTADPNGPSDFTGFPAGAIALIQRGGCSFALKVANAQTAGASAVILFNQGDTPARSVVLTTANAVPPNGSAFTTITIPLVGASTAAGQALAVPGATATVSVVNKPQRNVIAELPGRHDDNVVMAGAHLDSVQAGPGINDNGSGSAVLLELGQQLGNFKPDNTLRFAWWGGEEEGLLGSTAYVEDLTEAQRNDIALYLNFDMVGSPNYIFMVYDADQSSFEAPVPIPPGSTAIEDVFESFYTIVEEPYDDSAFDGRSDYQAFIDNNIPSGGLFTGAEDPKTEEQAAIWGGTAGEQLDPCYHLACDTFANNSDHALDVNADAVAYSVLTFAYSTEKVNGVRGRKVPGRFPTVAPAGSQMTWVP
jgi:Zn-dependent M28 family amino/carboxypeptidase